MCPASSTQPDCRTRRKLLLLYGSAKACGSHDIARVQWLVDACGLPLLLLQGRYGTPYASSGIR